MMDGMGGWWMGGGSLVVLALVVMAVVLWVRRTDNLDKPGRASSPEDVLADRFARGEIDEAEYQQRRASLRS